MAQVDDTIVEAVCRHGTGGGHVDWSPHLRKFADMKIQVPHFRGEFGITTNEGSAISAFYSTTCVLVVWLGSHSRSAQDFADAWAPGLDLTSPDSWINLFSRLFPHRMLFSFRIMGVLYGPLHPIECPHLCWSRLHSLLCSQVSAPVTLLPRYLL